MKGASAALLLLAALAAPASASAEEASPIGKVLQLITDLQAKVVAEGEAAQGAYAKFAEWCEDQSKDLAYEIKTGKAEVESLQATIAEETSTSSSLTTKIEELVTSIASNEADLKAATSIREKENADFLAEEKELTEITDMIERAIAILEREMQKGGASALLQTKNMGSLTDALKVMVQASLIGTEDASKLTAFVQSTSQDSDSDDAMGAPAGSVYEGHSGNIIDTLEGLLEKAQTQLADSRKKEVSAAQNFEMLKQSLTDEIEFASKDLTEAKKGVAGCAEKKSTAEGDLTVTSKDLAADIAAKGDLHQECMTKSEDFEAATKSRAEEVKALAEAKKVIAEQTGGAEDVSYGLNQVSLLQVRRYRLSSGTDLAHLEVVHFVRDLARKQRDPALAQLAARLASASSLGAMGGADPFAKIKGLISDMISKLEGEAGADATHKAYCDKEMSETQAKKEDKTAEIEKLATSIDQMSAQSAKLKEEVAELQSALAKLMASQAEMDKMRAEEKAMNEKNKADMELGLDGVKKALQILTAYYAKGDKAHAAAEGAGSSIIGLLEVCESDFSKDLAEIVTTEETAAAAYEQQTKENEVEKTTKSQDVKYKTKESTGLDKSVAEASSDRSGVQAELDAILDYWAKIQEQCVAKAEPYAEKKRRRVEEIAGLKQALEILESETALVQRSAGRRTLRGVSRHA